MSMTLEVSESEHQIYDDLNKLRTNPSSVKEIFTKSIKALSGIPSKKKKGDELAQHLKALVKINALNSVELSPGLCNAAHDILQAITQLGLKFHKEMTREQFKLTCRKHVGGFTHIVSMSDQGTIESFFPRVFISEVDEKGDYKKSIISSSTTFCGVASVIINDEPTSVLILADSITEGASKMIYDAEDYPDFFEAFNTLDVSKNGRINGESIKKILLDLGYYSKSPVVLEILEKIAASEEKQKEIVGTDFNSFMEVIMTKVNDSNKEGLYEIFRLFKDDPSTDTISLKELRKIATEIQDEELLADITGLIRLARTDTATLTFDEFKKFYFNEE